MFRFQIQARHWWEPITWFEGGKHSLNTKKELVLTAPNHGDADKSSCRSHDYPNLLHWTVIRGTWEVQSVVDRYGRNVMDQGKKGNTAHSQVHVTRKRLSVYLHRPHSAIDDRRFRLFLQFIFYVFTRHVPQRPVRAALPINKPSQGKIKQFLIFFSKQLLWISWERDSSD